MQLCNCLSNAPHVNINKGARVWWQMSHRWLKLETCGQKKMLSNGGHVADEQYSSRETLKIKMVYFLGYNLLITQVGLSSYILTFWIIHPKSLAQTPATCGVICFLIKALFFTSLWSHSFSQSKVLRVCADNNWRWLDTHKPQLMFKRKLFVVLRV